MKYLLIVLGVFFALSSFAQSPNDADEIKETIMNLFDGMREKDSLKVAGAFTSDAKLTSVFYNKEGQLISKSSLATDFVVGITKPNDDLYDERLWSVTILSDGPLASAWTEYSFFLNDTLLHCGVNSFDLVKRSDGWEISDIKDTRRKKDCMSEDTQTIDEFLDAWHLAAAVADEEIFFGSMSDEGIYIGTDASEHWKRDELKAWSEKYFAQESAWTFKAKDRHLFYSEDGQMVWFDELLDTWMGDCRGSGVLKRYPEGWKIEHYHLSIAVPNDVVNDYLKIIGKEGK